MTAAQVNLVTTNIEIVMQAKKQKTPKIVHQIDNKSPWFFYLKYLQNCGKKQKYKQQQYRACCMDITTVLCNR